MEVRMKIQVTDSAAAQIRASLGGAGGLGLRIAARTTPEGKLTYLMGLDEPAETDERIPFEGFAVLVAPDESAVLEGLTLDYVEIEPGQFHFIFQNPNDPDHKTLVQ
jgi:iron-sulfur cluster assembly protein